MILGSILGQKGQQNNPKQPQERVEDSTWKNILQWSQSKNLPLSLMLGVKRAVNKDFGLAGDGIGDINLKELSNLCNSFPKNKFLVTCLSLNDQHELTILARKHPNLKIDKLTHTGRC